MITTPTTYERERLKSGAVNITLVRIENDAGTVFWFADQEIAYIDEASDPIAHVYSNLLSHSGIKEGIDYFKKSWRVSSLTLKFSNAPYLAQGAGVFKRMSDLFDDLIDASIQVWLCAGSNIPFESLTLSDYAIKRFDGTISEIPSYDEEFITIKAIDLSFRFNKLLPEEYIGDVYSAEDWLENEPRKIPMIYGTFNGVNDSAAYSIGNGNGLAIAEKTTGFLEGKYVVSDKIPIATLSTSSIYTVLSGLLIPANFDSSDITVNLNDSGRVTFTIAYGADAYAYFLISDDSPRGTFQTDYQSNIVDYENVGDGSDSTFGQIEDDFDNGAGNFMVGGALFAIQNLEWLLDKIPDDNSDVQPKEYITDVKIQYKIVNDIILDTAEIHFLIGAATLTTPVNFNYTSSASRQISVDLIANLYGVNIDGIWIRCVDDDGGLGDGPNNQDMAKIYDLRVRAKITRKPEWHIVDTFLTTNLRGQPVEWPLLFPTRTQTNAIMPIGRIFVRANGKVYDAWLNDHSSSIYSVGNVIEDPISMIESILREYMGLVSADIDMDSFDDSENGTFGANTARINLHSDNEAMAFDVFRQLAEQSIFAFFFGANGKAKAIPLNNVSPTTSVTIPYSHIVKGKIKISKTTWIINQMKVESRFMQEFAKYQDFNKYDNATSQAESWGTRTYTARWPNVNGDSAALIANHLIINRDGTGVGNDPLWGYPRPIIEFTTPGFMYQHLEIGDWIELDDTTVDPHILLFGSSWSGVKFLISDLQNLMNGTRIKAIAMLTT